MACHPAAIGVAFPANAGWKADKKKYTEQCSQQLARAGLSGKYPSLCEAYGIAEADMWASVGTNVYNGTYIPQKHACLENEDAIPQDLSLAYLDDEFCAAKTAYELAKEGIVADVDRRGMFSKLLGNALEFTGVVATGAVAYQEARAGGAEKGDAYRAASAAIQSAGTSTASGSALLAPRFMASPQCPVRPDLSIPQEEYKRYPYRVVEFVPEHGSSLDLLAADAAALPLQGRRPRSQEGRRLWLP